MFLQVFGCFILEQCVKCETLKKKQDANAMGKHVHSACLHIKTKEKAGP